MRDLLKAAGIGLVLGSLLGAFFFTVDLTPVQASAEAVKLDALLRTYLAISGLIFGLVVAFVAYSVIVFRRREAEARGAAFRGHRGLERGWLLVTTALVLISAFDATLVLNEVLAPRVGYAQPELEIKGTARQWSWTYQYPAYGITSAVLVLEKDRPAVVRVTSTDVVHSLFVPEFRLKFDALPGLENTMRVVPTVLGAFRTECAALCGVGHTVMGSDVRVLDSAGFQAWVAEQKSK
ncbi:MAG: cytochrome c oxidase subunit II [Chloroflexi bacterium]|nr:cytochrome c oxidase subunit II [Chloroflexota bacterium]